MKYTADAEKGLTNGDTVEITAEFAKKASEATSVLTETEKQYTVEGMPAYISSLDDIPQDTYEKMDTVFRDGYAAYLANPAYGATGVIQEMTLLGNYVLTLKSTTNGGSPYNYVYFVYKVNATFDRTGENHDYYWCAYYEGVYTLPDGTMVVDYDDLHKGSLNYDNLLIDAHYVEGCNDLDSIFNKNVTTKIAEYDYTTTIDE